jgi:hypothetical protein
MIKRGGREGRDESDMTAGGQMIERGGREGRDESDMTAGEVVEEDNTKKVGYKQNQLSRKGWVGMTEPEIYIRGKEPTGRDMVFFFNLTGMDRASKSGPGEIRCES